MPDGEDRGPEATNVLPLRIANDEIQTLADVRVPPKFYSRLQTGVPIIDEIFGGQDMPGILPGTTFLYTGTPGAGKSTMCLQLADLLQRNAGLNVLYNIGEEARQMVKLRADRIKVVGHFGISEIDQVDQLITQAKETGVEVLFQDSLQSLQDGDWHGDRKLKRIVKKFHALAKEDDVTIFIVGHSNKAGKFAGPQQIKHDLDVHAHLKLNADSGGRVFELEKNRFGPGGIPYEFQLTRDGLQFAQLQEAEGSISGGAPPAGGRAAERKAAILKLIRDALLAGDSISGYCFDRFKDPLTHQDGVMCSGGFWRGMVAKATRDLRALGHQIGERKDGPSGTGRLHVFIIKEEDQPPEEKQP